MKTEMERKAFIERWNNTVAANPHYGGLTIVETTRRFLKVGKWDPRKSKSTA